MTGPATSPVALADLASGADGVLTLTRAEVASLFALSETAITLLLGPAGELALTVDGSGEIEADRRAFSGTAVLPRLFGAPVAAALEAKGRDGALRTVLRLTCPPGWNPGDSFPDLPLDWEDEPSHIRRMILHDAALVIASHDADGICAGIGLTADWEPGGLLGVLDAAFQASQGIDATGRIAVMGQLAVDGPPDAPDVLYPWDRDQPPAGLYLHADLGISIGVGDSLDWAEVLGVRLYSPFEGEEDDDIALSQMALVSVLDIGPARLTLSATMPEGEALTLHGRLTVPDDSKHETVAALTGGHLMDSDLPFLEELLRALDHADVRLSVDFSERRPSVSAVTLDLGFVRQPCRWLDDLGLPSICVDRLRVTVIEPFAEQALSWYGTLDAGAELCGFDLEVTANFPDVALTANASRPGDAPVDIAQVFDALQVPAAIPRPPSLAIEDLSLFVDGRAFWSAHLAVTPESTWSDASGTHHFPTLGFTLTSDGWIFEAGIDDEAVPVSALLGMIARAFPAQADLTLPGGLDGLSVTKVRMAHQSGVAERFEAEITGRIAALGTDTVFEVHAARDGSDAFVFGGRIVLMADGPAPRTFELAFEDGEAGAVLVGGYSDPDGPPVKLAEIVRTISPAQGAMVPEGIEFALRNAVLGIRPQTGRNDVLVGVDLDAGFDLSAPQLDGLPLVSEALSGETLRLALQFVFADAAFASEDIDRIREMSEAARFLPEDGVAQGLGLSATLRMGDEQRQIGVPFGPEALDQAQPPGEKAPTAAPDADIATGTTQWFTLQKSFGPVHVDRIGVDFRDGEAWALVDGSLSAAGLTLSLDGFAVHSPLRPWTPAFALSGLGVDYATEGFEIGGAFLERDLVLNEVDADGQSHARTLKGFGGDLVIRGGDFSLSAAGLYADLGGMPSFFVYAALNRDLGGPAFFFVKGLAATFGYNRALRLPEAKDVQHFPLVTMAMDATDGDAPHDPAAALTALEQVVPPRAGAGFLGIGIHFESFKVIDSFALLVGRLDEKLEINLIGTSTLETPPRNSPGAEGRAPLARAVLGLEASFVPEDGVLKVRAELQPGAFLISKKCHLTGGFAFYSWFKRLGAIPAGDFVLTLGGYHRLFKPPPHYPNVPALGFRWRIDRHLTLKGSAYFAMTMGAMMAGGRLEAVWKSGDVKVTFTATADFLIAWQPYHYDARMNVSMHANVTVHFFGTHHLTFDANARLHLWGPEFAGEAHVDMRVMGFDVSFDVGFGVAGGRTQALTWETFRATSLPERLCEITIEDGLVREMPGDDTRWIVDRKQMKIRVSSAVPLSGQGGAAAGIAPMGLLPGEMHAELDAVIRPAGGGDTVATVSAEPVFKSVPSALWGQSRVTQLPGVRFVDPPTQNDTGLIEHALVGYTLEAHAPDECGAGDPIVISSGTPTEVWAGQFWLLWRRPDPTRSEVTPDLAGRAAMLAALDALPKPTKLRGPR